MRHGWSKEETELGKTGKGGGVENQHTKRQGRGRPGSMSRRACACVADTTGAPPICSPFLQWWILSALAGQGLPDYRLSPKLSCSKNLPVGCQVLASGLRASGLRAKMIYTSFWVVPLTGRAQPPRHQILFHAGSDKVVKLSWTCRWGNTLRDGEETNPKEPGFLTQQSHHISPQREYTSNLLKPCDFRFLLQQMN